MSPIDEGCRGLVCIVIAWLSHVFGALPPLSIVISLLGLIIALHSIWRIVVRCVWLWGKYGWRAIVMPDID